MQYANQMNELNEKWGFNIAVTKVELFSQTIGQSKIIQFNKLNFSNLS